MITYNHEKYIEQAIQGVLMQQTKFDYELIIADDASTDNTKKVIEHVLATHENADKIRFISHSENKGMYTNFLFSLSQSSCKYIAVCEGDEFWTEPLKLQTQIDFLEANPDYEVCFTNIKIVNDHNEQLKERLITDNRRTDYEKRDLPIWAPTLTRVFRNRNFSELPNAPGLDTIMLLWQSQFGKIKFINTITGSYRKHSGGIYSASSEAKRKNHIVITTMKSVELIDKTLYPKYFGMIYKKLVELKPISEEFFLNNKTTFKILLRTKRGEFTFLENMKIHIAWVLISLPQNKTNPKWRKVSLKILNKLFIYT